MKMKNVIWFVWATSLASGSSLAQGTHVGGGDSCRDEINKHREALYSWIQSNDSSDLDFTQAKGEVHHFSDYQKRMLEVLAPGKVVVTCYLDPSRLGDPLAQQIARREGVSYKAITIGNPALPTECMNYEDQSGVSHIDCNYDAIVNAKALADPNYQLTHHEYASIAGVERRTQDSEPDFTISRQLAQYEEWVKVKRLGKKRAQEPQNAPVPTFEQTGFECSSWDPYAKAPRDVIYFAWKPNGDYFLAHQKIPPVQRRAVNHFFDTDPYPSDLGELFNSTWWFLNTNAIYWLNQNQAVTQVLSRGHTIGFNEKEFDNSGNMIGSGFSTEPEGESSDYATIRTNVTLSETPVRSSLGIPTDFLIRITLPNSKNLPRTLRNKIISMSCSQELKRRQVDARPHLDFKEVFAKPNTKVFRQSFIRDI